MHSDCSYKVQKKIVYNYYDWFDIFRIFMNRMKTVIKLTFICVKGAVKSMAKSIFYFRYIWTSLPSAHIYGRKWDSKKTLLLPQFKTSRLALPNSKELALWAQVHNWWIIEAISLLSSWRLSSSPPAPLWAQAHISSARSKQECAQSTLSASAQLSDNWSNHRRLTHHHHFSNQFSQNSRKLSSTALLSPSSSLGQSRPTAGKA